MRVAIDGPAGVGKTTSARRVAERLGYLYIDTGAMYRALALKALETGLDPDVETAAGLLARGTEVGLEPDGTGGSRVMLDGRDVSEAIRTPAVSDGASRIAVHREVRERMVALQRALSRRLTDAGRGAVMEGRDIGTAVLPDAEVKIYLDARPEERARRRWVELESKGARLPFERVLEEILERDARDTGRTIDPLRAADDAIVLDSTEMSLDEQVGAILDVIAGATKERDSESHRAGSGTAMDSRRD